MSEIGGSYKLLESIGSPDDMKSLTPEQLRQLSSEPVSYTHLTLPTITE